MWKDQSLKYQLAKNQLSKYSTPLLIPLALVLVGLSTMGGCSASGRSADGSSGVTVVTRVLNGTPVESSAIPQLVQVINTEGENTLACTGSVIDSQHVLTAGHCAQGQGTITVQNALFTATVIKAAVHPGYFEDQNVLAIFNDVAVLEVSTLPVPSLPVIAQDQALTDYELSGVLYGFGVSASDSDGNLQGGAVTIAETTPNHLLSTPADGDTASSCNGDSGAPLVASTTYEGQLVFGIKALVSTGSTADCGSGDITYYTNLSAPGIAEFIQGQAPQATIIK